MLSYELLILSSTFDVEVIAGAQPRSRRGVLGLAQEQIAFGTIQYQKYVAEVHHIVSNWPDTYF